MIKRLILKTKNTLSQDKRGKRLILQAKGAALLVIAGTLFLLSACGGLDNTIWTPDPIEQFAPPEPPPVRADADTDDYVSGWTPGTFVGVGTGGFGGDIHVEVLIDAYGRIASVTITEHRETQAYLMMAEMQVIGSIIRTQSTDVDTFAGATLSSVAIIEAVEDALSAA